MSPVEREHIVAAYTFELGKCYEQSIKERGLQVLANIDPELCAPVAAGLGLPAPEPTVALEDVEPSPALSQVGGDWPADGRLIAIVTDGQGDLDGVRAVRQAVLDGGMVPLVVAPAGGKLDAEGPDPVTVQRTFTTARSIEFDAVLLAGAPGRGADAFGARDAKAGEPASGTPTDPRVLLLVDEAFRHGKAIGVWGGGGTVLDAAGVPSGAPGVVSADSGPEVLAEVTRLLAKHRVWERFTAAG
jgi:catalase